MRYFSFDPPNKGACPLQTSCKKTAKIAKTAAAVFEA
jgi:hypothetical protein